MSAEWFGRLRLQLYITVTRHLLRGGTETFFSPLGRQSRVLIGCPSRSRCAAALPSAPGWAHAPRPPLCARPGPTAIGQGVGEKQGHPIKKLVMPLSVVSRQMTNLCHGTAPSVRVRAEGAMHCGRCRHKYGTYDAPQRARARFSKRACSARDAK